MSQPPNAEPDYRAIIEKLLNDLELIRRAMEPLPGNVAKDVAALARAAIAGAKESLHE